MKERFCLTKGLVMGAAVFFAFNFATAQSVSQGINDIDGFKIAAAKQNFEQMVTKDPSDENYFYLGNTYLVQNEPDFAKANDIFEKGLDANKRAKKSYFSRIGEASVKLGRGDKAGAIADFAEIAKDSREKDADVLYRIGQALTLYPKNDDPKLAVDYLNKAIDLAQKKGVPEYYYYTLGDAYRQDKQWGQAMNAYESALSVQGGNKAAAYTRMGTLWTAAKQYKLAKENIDKALAAGPNYAPAWKAEGNYNIIYQNWQEAAQDYKKYLDLADSDPTTVLDYAKLAFIAKDYTNAANALNSVWDKIQDPIKYRIKAYLQFNNGDYAGAKQSLDTFLSTVEKSRILPSDSGLEGLIMAGLAKQSNDDAAMAKAKQLVQVAVDAKDETFNWDQEFAKVSGIAPKLPGADQGPTNATIQQLRQQLVNEPKNTDLMFKLAQEYVSVQNWGGAAATWQQMIDLIPDWAPAYNQLGFACQKGGDADAAIAAYKTYVQKITANGATLSAQEKQTVSGAYFNLANLIQAKGDYAGALPYANQAVQLNPTDQPTVQLRDAIQKRVNAGMGTTNGSK